MTHRQGDKIDYLYKRRSFVRPGLVCLCLVINYQTWVAERSAKINQKVKDLWKR